MTNTVWITKTPPTIYEYEVEFSRTLPTSGPNGNRQARAVARREEKAMIFRAFQQRLNPGNAQQGVHNGVNFAFSHQCDLIWTVSPMPGSFTNNVQHFDTIQYSRKDGVQETLDRLSIRRRNTHSFNASITTQDVHGTAAQPLNGDPLLALLTAFVSQHALMNVNTVKVGANRHFQPSNAPFNTQLSVVSLKIAQGFLLTVRAVRHGLGILINNTTTCFVQEQTVAQYIRDLRSRRLDNRYLNTVLRGLRVKININRGSSPAGAGPSRNRDALEYRVKSIWSAGQNLRFQQYYANAGDPTGRSVLNFFQNTCESSVFSCTASTVSADKYRCGPSAADWMGPQPALHQCWW